MEVMSAMLSSLSRAVCNVEMEDVWESSQSPKGFGVRMP